MIADEDYMEQIRLINIRMMESEYSHHAKDDIRWLISKSNSAFNVLFQIANCTDGKCDHHRAVSEFLHEARIK